MQQKLERKAPRLARFLKEIEIQFKWLFIWLFLKVLTGPSRRRKKPLNPQSVKSVLILRQDKIGDMVVTLPTIHTLRYHRRDIKIGVLASAVNYKIIEHDAAVARVHIWRKSLPKIIKTVREIRKCNYDAVIDLMTGTSVTSLVIAMLCAPRAYRIGIAKESFRKYYDYYTLEKMNHAHKLHITEMFRATLEPLGIKLANGVTECKIALSEKQQERGRQLAEQIRDLRFDALIMLNVSAGKLDRTLSFDKFVKLVGVLSSKFPRLQFLISYAPNEERLARTALEAGSENVSLLPSGVSIMELIALMNYFQAIVSVDTSICHIAANLNVPLLAMYNGNNFNFSRWYPYSKRVWIVRSPDWKSVDGITFEQLSAAVDNFISDLSSQSVLKKVQ